MDNLQAKPLENCTFEELIAAGSSGLDAGNFQEAQAALRKSLDIAERASDKKGQVKILLLLARVLRTQAQGKAARIYAEKAVELSSELFGDKSSEMASALDELGSVDFEARCYETSENKFRQALEIRENISPLPELELAESYVNLGMLLTRLERLSEAESMLNKGLGIRKRLLPFRHHKIAECLHCLSELHLSKGNVVLSLPLAEEAKEYYESKFGKEHPSTAYAMHSQAVQYHCVGKLKEAANLLKSVIDIQESKLPSGHPRTISSINEYAATCLKLGKADEAESLYEKALSLCETNNDVAHDMSVAALVGLGVSHLEQRRYKEAEKHIKRALSMLDRVPKNVVYLEKSLLYNLLHSLIWQGKLADALRLVPDTVRARQTAEVTEMAEMLDKLYKLVSSQAGNS